MVKPILKATKSVYAYYLPEVRKTIDSILPQYPHKLYLESIFPGLDNFHLPIIEKFIKSRTFLQGLDLYKNRYAINGSSEAIFHLLSYIKSNHKNPKIYILKGEYEGYKAYAGSLNLKVTEVESIESLRVMPPGFVFISNPSAIDGNIISDANINSLADAGHKIIYDGAYFDTTELHNFDLKHKNIIAVLCSFSKPFGLFYYRVGFMFSRIDINSLNGNIWFKNIFSLLIADKLIQKYKPGDIIKKHQHLQKESLAIILNDTGLKIRPCDIYLLGYLNINDYKSLSSQLKKLVAPFKRGDYYRFSLTPYFLELESK